MTSVLVLNASYEPIHRVSLHHALRMLYRGVAVVHEADGDRAIGPFVMPKVLRLIKYIYMKWRVNHPAHWTKHGVLKRDGHRCCYCGSNATTVDHVVPKSRGGLSTWGNTVAACLKCNSRKGNRTLKESGMKLMKIPYIPSYDQVHDLNV